SVSLPSSPAAPPDLHSFPTRRSSDLLIAVLGVPQSVLCGGCGIRTHETFLPTGFQDQLHRPLGQPSSMDESTDQCSSLAGFIVRSEEHTSELQSRENLVCRLLLEKKK